MAGMAKTKDKLTVLHVKDKKEFIKAFNTNKPSDEFIGSCKKAWRLFGETRKETHTELSTTKR